MSQWDLIGKRDPQLPQMFYPVANTSTTLMPGDVIAARCTMVKNLIFYFHWVHLISYYLQYKMYLHISYVII